MRLWSTVAGLALLVAALLTGCSGGSSSGGNQTANGSGKGSSNAPGNTARNTPPDNIRRVTITELKELLEQGKAVVVDVRGDEAFKLERIKGAVNIPENQITARAGELPKDKLIAFYCS